MDTSFIATNQPCPDCGSSDALAVNEDGSTKCFSCETFNPKGEGKPKKQPMKKQNNFEHLKGEASPLPARGIHLDTCKKYNYKVGKNEKGEWVHIANYIDDDGKPQEIILKRIGYIPGFCANLFSVTTYMLNGGCLTS